MPPANEKPAQEKKPFSISALQTQKAQSVRLADKAKRDPVLRKILVARAASEATIADLTARLEVAEKRSADFDASTGKLRNELLAAESSLASANSSIATYQAEAKTSADALAALRKELAAAQAELATAEASLGKAAGRIAELEKSGAAADAELVKVRKELAAALKKVAPSSGS